jgi:hypothetical protein
MPKRWSALGCTLEKCLQGASQQVIDAFESIRLRNANLADPAMRPFVPDLEPGQAKVVKLLDAAKSPINIVSLSAQIYTISIDVNLLMRTLCDYAVTRFRPGVQRIYLVASILAEWPFGEKLSVQDGVVRYFEQKGAVDDEMQRIISLIAELMERRIVSYSWLLRRCIARGWTQNSVLSRT